MIGRSLGLAMILVLVVIGFANAKTNGATTIASKTGVAVSATNASSFGSTSDGNAVTVGWKFAHVSNCFFTFDGTNAVLYVYPSEGGYFSTTFAPYQALIAPACQTGNVMAFYVDDTSGDWSQLYTYTSK